MSASETMRSEADGFAAERVLELAAGTLDASNPAADRPGGSGPKVGTLDPAQLAPAAAR
jgi:hypothetical protein